MTTSATTPDPVARLREVLGDRRPHGVVAAWVFGSAADGRMHDESDLDVGVLFDPAAVPSKRERFEAQLELRRHLSPGVVGRDIDVVVLNDVTPLLGRRVVGTGVRVYCGDDRLEHAFRRNVQLRAADLEPFINRMRRLTLEGLSR